MSSILSSGTKGVTDRDRVLDPNAPKRGLSAYMFFANDNREKVREDNPGITFGKRRTPILTIEPC